MRKVVAGLAVALVLCAGAYLGVAYWAQRAAAREVDAVLDNWRQSVGTATRGRVEFDLWTRTLRVADIVVQSQTAPRTKMTIAQVVASGIDGPGRASRVEIVDLEVSDVALGLPGGKLRQRAPRVILTGYSARPVAPRKAGSAVDTARLWLEQFSAVAAASIDIPTLTLTVAAEGAGAPKGIVSAEYTYTNIALRDVRDGRVAEATAEGMALRSSIGTPHGEMRGEIGKVSIADLDVGPLLAFLDPSRARDEGYQRLYRRFAVGPYTLRQGDGTSFSIDRMVAEDIGLRPAKLSLDDIIFVTEVAAPSGGGMMTPEQMGMLTDKVAGFYEGVHLGRLELRGLEVTGKRDNLKIASLRLDGLESGRLAGLSVEGLSGRDAVGDPLKFKLGRMAIRGLDIASLLRTVSTQVTSPGEPQELDRLIGMLTLLQGIELKDIAVPDPNTGRTLNLQALDASWGQFIGNVPSQVQISAKFTGPVSPMDPAPFDVLARHGIDRLATSADIGIRWVEKQQVLALERASIEIGNMLSLSLKASVGNVTRDAFATDPVKAIGGAAMAEAGPIEVSLRDLGVVALVAAEAARARGAAPEEGRTLLLEALARNAEALAQTSPDAQLFLQALAELVGGKADTLSVRLTPKGRVGVLQLIEAGRRDAVAALLGSFDVEAKAAR